ncbi:MAG: FtsK/SpoIIIE domain-containing protein [Niallia nealsonii]|nr:FtsK/SpoIIIE domain-containing protein [Niallia nealsonii]
MKSEKERISLLNNYVDWISVLNKIEVAVHLFLITIVITIMLTIGGFLSFILLSVIVYISLLFHKGMKKRRRIIRDKYFIRDRLRYFIQANNLFEESIRESEQRDNQGRWSIVREKYISNSAVFSYEQTETKLIVYAYKNADNFTAKMSRFEEGLRSLFGLDIEQVLDRNTVVEYHMIIESPERLDLTITNEIKIGNSLDINLGYGVTYNPVKCPHILMSGGTGSGKSVFISFLLLEFLKRKSTVYICDPKNSDLGSLSHYIGDEKIATTSNNIARVVRLAVSEMNDRYKHMNENFIYGSNFVDHGYNPIWLVFDEMGAFQASGTDKKSKEVVNEVMEGLKQIILLGRQSGVFVLVSAQQMNSNTLNTDLRDNLGLRIALGANSQEGYRMVFGSSTPETIPPIEVKGSGLLYMQGSGKESAQYYESPFVDMRNFNFIKELKRYI